MGKETIAFGNIEIKKCKFHYCQNLILLQDVDIHNILIFNIVPSGGKNCKYFTFQKDDYYEIRPLQIMFPKKSACVKSYDGETK